MDNPHEKSTQMALSIIEKYRAGVYKLTPGLHEEAERTITLAAKYCYEPKVKEVLEAALGRHTIESIPDKPEIRPTVITSVKPTPSTYALDHKTPQRRVNR
jgi:hypothetical protein